MTIAKTRIAAIIGCVGLFACGPSGDWRAQAVADAENQIRTAVNDPSAEFSSVQVTGDDTTGQTCGFVSAKISTGGEQSGHFIVYIDGSAGPYIENNLDGQSMPHEKFEFAWENDCLKEGYKD
ncbi:MAG TPA: hypothetical protein VID67_12545 [Rhizomicrobium sp.]